MEENSAFHMVCAIVKRLLNSILIIKPLKNPWYHYSTSHCMACLWGSKAQPLICDTHRSRTSLQEKSCSSHQAQAKRFPWPQVCKPLQTPLYAEPCSLWREKEVRNFIQSGRAWNSCCILAIKWKLKCLSLSCGTWRAALLLSLTLNVVCIGDNLQFLTTFEQ